MVQRRKKWGNQFSFSVRTTNGRKWEWTWGTPSEETTKGRNRTARRARSSRRASRATLSPQVSRHQSHLGDDAFPQLPHDTNTPPAGRSMRRPSPHMQYVSVVSPGTLTVPSGKLAIGATSLLLQGKRSDAVRTVLIDTPADTYPVVARIASYTDRADVGFLELWLSGRAPVRWRSAGRVSTKTGSITLASSEAYGLLWTLRLTMRTLGSQLSAVWSALQAEELRLLRAQQWRNAAIIRMTLDRPPRYDAVIVNVGEQESADIFIGYDADGAPAVVVVDSGILPWSVRAEGEGAESDLPAAAPSDPGDTPPAPTSVQPEPPPQAPQASKPFPVAVDVPALLIDPVPVSDPIDEPVTKFGGQPV